MEVALLESKKRTLSPVPISAPVVPTPVGSGQDAATEARKERRELDVRQSVNVLNYRATHSINSTLERFPEISKSTLLRKKRKEAKLRKELWKGKGTSKRTKGFSKYDALAKQLYQFFTNIRDLHGGVSRGLLEAYALTLPDDVKKDYFQVNRTSQDDFWKRWRTFYDVVYRRVSGLKQYVPTDNSTRIETFNGLLHSLYQETHFQTILCGDETGVRIRNGHLFFSGCLYKKN